MKRIWSRLAVLCLAALLLSGCSMTTVDKMYRLPKRSEEYNNLQSAIDKAMTDLEYCAPQAGEYQQTVQMADLDGDSTEEYLVFAKGTAEQPMQILVFHQVGEDYVLTQTLESHGTAFDRVEYVQMDGKPGVELVVGRQVSDQVMGAVSVYSFHSGEAEQIVKASYTKFVTCELDGDGLCELLVLRPGQTESDKGIAELYGMKDGTPERYTEVSMSEPVDKLKRVITGSLHDGHSAVFVASTVAESAIITDVYAVIDGMFTNVSLSMESGTSVQTLRSYYVYADDIDNDGVVELPSLITMRPLTGGRSADMQYLIRWFALTSEGQEVDKMFTFHNYADGWYFRLDSQWAHRLTVEQHAEQCDFYLWDEAGENVSRLLSVFTFTGPDRETQAIENDRFVLHRTDSTVYAAELYDGFASLGVTREDLINNFYLIRQDWKTGET